MNYYSDSTLICPSRWQLCVPCKAAIRREFPQFTVSWIYWWRAFKAIGVILALGSKTLPAVKQFMHGDYEVNWCTEMTNTPTSLCVHSSQRICVVVNCCTQPEWPAVHCSSLLEGKKCILTLSKGRYLQALKPWSTSHARRLNVASALSAQKIWAEVLNVNVSDCRYSDGNTVRRLNICTVGSVKWRPAQLRQR